METQPSYTLHLAVIFLFLSMLYVVCIFMPVERIAEMERKKSAAYPYTISAREELRRRGSF